MSTGTKGDWSDQVGFRLESAEQRKELEKIRVAEDYPNLSDMMRDLVEEKIENSDAA